MSIDERNYLRINAGLPQLDVEAERARLATVQRDAEFENYFGEKRYRYAALWADAGLVGSPVRDCGHRQGVSFDWNLTPVLRIDGLSRMPFERHH
jgi:hypothetical protein